MSLYSAFYSGLSGLSTNANALNVIGNNLSNINTVGFKGSDMTFRDIFSSAGATATQGNGNPIQFGLGVQMNSVNQNFAQSSFQSTGNALDMAIQGNGFFTLQTAGGTQVFSRAGNFTRNSDGYLVASDGANVMGWNRSTDPTTGLADVLTTGTMVPVQISSATVGAQATKNITLGVNLNASGTSFQSPIQVLDTLGQAQNLLISYTNQGTGAKATTGLTQFGNLDHVAKSPDTKTIDVFDSLGNVQKAEITYSFLGAGGRPSTAISESVNLNPNAAVGDAYAAGPFTVYDSLGAAHTLNASYANTGTGAWSYSVTEGLNTLSTGALTYSASTGKFAQVGSQIVILDAGTPPTSTPITFDMTGFTSTGTSSSDGADAKQIGGAPAGDQIWNYAIRDANSTSSTPVATGILDFPAAGGAPKSVLGSTSAAITWRNGTSSSINLDTAGLTSVVGNNSTVSGFAADGNAGGDLTWAYTVVDAANSTGMPIKTGTMGFDSKGNLVALDGVKPLGTLTPDPKLDVTWLNNTTSSIQWNILNANGSPNYTSLSAPSSTASSSQDGYTAGTLSSVSVDPDGMITGTFTNGQILKMAQVGISSFTNVNGLEQAGNNHWSQTLSSGSPTTGVANQGGRGAILGSNLELSNVDVASEFTKLIVSQRGYQANAKIVTTTDELLQVTLNLKQ